VTNLEKLPNVSNISNVGAVDVTAAIVATNTDLCVRAAQFEPFSFPISHEGIYPNIHYITRDITLYHTILYYTIHWYQGTIIGTNPFFGGLRYE